MADTRYPPTSLCVSGSANYGLQEAEPVELIAARAQYVGLLVGGVVDPKIAVRSGAIRDEDRCY